MVFLGLAVLGTEFSSARRLGAFLKRILARASAGWRARRERRLVSPS
ncbi:PGPGW domain-containing protein [Cryobacterium gelidum]